MKSKHYPGNIKELTDSLQSKGSEALSADLWTHKTPQCPCSAQMKRFLSSLPEEINDGVLQSIKNSGLRKRFQTLNAKCHQSQFVNPLGTG